MITIRDRNGRGPTKIDWLDSKHSFSFGYYQDPNHMGFGPLRVLNEDKVKPGAGFGRRLIVTWRLFPTCWMED